MSDNESKIPRDEFSTLRRQLADNPEAVQASSRVDIADFYGRLETWTVDTFRVEGATTAFVQRMSPDAALRLVIPPQVMQTLTRQGDSLTTKTRQRSGRKAIATRIARGDVLGNPEALRKARRQQRRGK